MTDYLGDSTQYFIVKLDHNIAIPQAMSDFSVWDVQSVDLAKKFPTVDEANEMKVILNKWGENQKFQGSFEVVERKVKDQIIKEEQE